LRCSGSCIESQMDWTTALHSDITTLHWLRLNAAECRRKAAKDTRGHAGKHLSDARFYEHAAVCVRAMEIVFQARSHPAGRNGSDR